MREQARELAMSPADRARRDLAVQRDQAQARLAAASAPIPEPPALSRARALAAAASAESGTGFTKTTAAEKAVTAIENREPRGLFAFFQRPAWRKAVADAKARHAAEKGVWQEAAEARRDAQRALDRETQLAARARLPVEQRNQVAAAEARSDLAVIAKAEALLKERPDLARYGADAVIEMVLRQIEEERRRALEEARRQHRQPLPEPEPEPAGPRFR